MPNVQVEPSEQRPSNPPLEPPEHPSSIHDIHNFALLVWELDEEPQHTPDNPSTPAPILHLYTKTGLCILAPWPEHAILGDHYIAWAPQNASPTHH